MAQWSFPHSGVVTGDCGPYAADQFAQMMEYTLIAGRASSEGVIPHCLNGLRPAGLTNPMHINTGVAIVKGRVFISDVIEDLPIDGFVGPGTDRIDLLVVRHTWATQLVRLAVHKNPANDVVAPLPTQIYLTTWEIPVCEVVIDAGGLVSYEDVREIIRDKAVVGARQGGDPDAWDVAGTTNYPMLHGSMIQCGALSLAANGGTTLTFPLDFLHNPVVTYSLYAGAGDLDQYVFMENGTISFDSVDFYNSHPTDAIEIHWIAAGYQEIY